MRINASRLITKHMSTATPLFVYGTLMSEQVLRVLIGRKPPMVKPAFLWNHDRKNVLGQCYPAIVPSDSIATTTNNGDNNQIITTQERSSNKYVEGVLIFNLSKCEMKALDYFEADEYDKKLLKIWFQCSDMMSCDNLEEAIHQNAALSNDGCGHNILSDTEKRAMQSEKTKTTDINDWRYIEANVYVWADSETLLSANDWNYENFYTDHLDWYIENTVKPCRLDINNFSMCPASPANINLKT